MIRLIVFIGFILTMAIGSQYERNSTPIVVDSESTAQLLVSLGDSIMQSKRPNYAVEGISATRGKELIINGFTSKPNGGTTGRQSSHFICVSCHNIEREDPDMTINDPEARLLYTSEKELPFLQGTSLYGAINRETYYNGDYDKKYGDLVQAARNDVRGAIQLCATECAQGRLLDDWELESILAFLWTIDIKMSDLNLGSKEDTSIIDAKTKKEKEQAIALLKSKYLLKSDATFVYPPEDRSKGYPYQGETEKGKLIYENSCLHCHYQQRYSFFHLDKGSMSRNHLAAKAGSFSRQSLYQVIRWGVPGKSGKPSYMPHYTKEKMSDEMVEDLRAYLNES